jgi:DNA-binding transcriptional regulator YiaG
MSREKITQHVAGLVFTAEIPVRISREGPVFHARDLRRFELSVARRLPELGVATGEAFRFMRKSLGLALTQVAALFDVDPETVRGWEPDDAAMPRAAFVLLGTMADDELQGIDTTRRYLEALTHPPSQAAGEIPVTIEESEAEALTS